MAKIHDLLDGSMNQRKVRGLVPCCGQDGYRAQLLQHPIDSYNIQRILLVAKLFYSVGSPRCSNSALSSNPLTLNHFNYLSHSLCSFLNSLAI